MNKFKDLELAIKAEEDKLKELYGVEKELTSLTLVVNAHKDYIANIENEKAQKTEEYTEKMKTLENEFKAKQNALEQEYELKAKALKLERDREQEEYNYNTKRERELSNNAWEDEKRQREAELSAKEKETAKLLSEAKANETYLKELEAEVNDFAEALEKEYSRGRKEATTELEKEHKYNTELLKKDYQSKIDLQADKIDTLMAELEKQRELSNSLQEKMDKAYAEMKELATRTVETSGVVKLVGNNTVSSEN